MKSLISDKDMKKLLQEGVEYMSEFAQQAGNGSIPEPGFCFQAGTWTGKALLLIGELDTKVKNARFRDDHD